MVLWLYLVLVVCVVGRGNAHRETKGFSLPFSKRERGKTFYPSNLAWLALPRFTLWRTVAHQVVHVRNLSTGARSPHDNMMPIEMCSVCQYIKYDIVRLCCIHHRQSKSSWWMALLSIIQWQGGGSSVVDHMLLPFPFPRVLSSALIRSRRVTNPIF